MINNLPYNNTIRDYYLSTNKNVSSFSDSEDSSIKLEKKKNGITYYEICSFIRDLNREKEEWEKHSIEANERLLEKMSKYGG